MRRRAGKLTLNGVGANYTTSKFFIDEIAGETPRSTVVFKPNEANLIAIEVYTNLNRHRDFALMLIPTAMACRWHQAAERRHDHHQFNHAIFARTG